MQDARLNSGRKKSSKIDYMVFGKESLKKKDAFRVFFVYASL